MQPRFQSLTRFAEYLGWAVAIFSAIGNALQYWVGRRKIPSEIHKTEAEAELTQAKAEEIRFRTRASITEMLNETSIELARVTVLIPQLQARVSAQEVELKLLRDQMDERIAPSKRS